MSSEEDRGRRGGGAGDQWVNSGGGALQGDSVRAEEFTVRKVSEKRCVIREAKANMEGRRVKTAP